MANSNEPVLTFISVDESKEENLRRASKVSKDYELKCKWISTSSLHNVKGLDLKTENSVFVLELFVGEIYEYLKSKNSRIVGPQCILSCLQTQTSLPNVQYSVFCVTMRGCCVSCTSVPRQERDRLYELIQLMGGVAIKDFTSSVTHLVAGEVGSKKYKVARSFNKPILLPEWVYSCWERGRNSHICASDEDFTEFKCPVFRGVTLCVTGIDAGKRKEVKQLVSKHGGTYSGELNMKTCTHLLVDIPKGEKYEFARRWNLHCVSMQWFYDSIQSGYCLEESHYLTLPEDELNGSQVRSRVPHSLVSNTSALLKSSTEKKNSTKAAQAAYKSAQKHGNGDLISVSGNKKLLNQTLLHSVSALGETHLSELEGSNFDVNIQPGNMFLDGCKIYLSGFGGEKLDKLRKIINSGGGTRFNQINEIVSHVIIGERVETDLEILKDCEFQGYVVVVQWILESARKGKRLSEEDYLCLDLIQKEELSPSSKENKDPEAVQTTANRSEPQHPIAGAKKDHDTTNCQEEGFDDDEVFLQYMPQNTDGEEGIKSVDSDRHSGEDRVEMRAPSMDPDATLDDDEFETDGGLLFGKYFTVAGFAEEHVEHLWQLIQSNGGKPVKTKESRTADYAILYMNTVPEDDLPAKHLATFCWLEQSLECGKLLNLEDSFLFKPFCVPRGCQPLQGCVLSISQFSGVEVDHMYQLAELLGAFCQEYFVRKASSRYQANTHLLCQKPEGNKYKAAVNWQIPVVSKEWLFACASTGTLVSVEEYPIGMEVTEKAAASNQTSMKDASVYKKDSTSDFSPLKLNPKPQDQAPMTANDGPSALEKLHKPVAQRQNRSVLPENCRNLPKPAIKRPPVNFHPFRPSFDLTDVMAELASPAVPNLRSRKSRGSRCSFPLDDFFAQNIKQTLEKIGGVGPPGEEGDAILDGDPVEGNQQGQASSKEGFLAGIVLSVSKKLAQQQTELYSVATSLGADYRWLYDESCTHLIHQGSASDKTKEFIQAKERGIQIVSPHWLHACQEKSKRVDETLYPHTYNPKLTLPVVTTGSRRLTRSTKAALAREASPQKKKKSPTLKYLDPREQQPTEKPVNDNSCSVATAKACDDKGVAEHETEQRLEMGSATLESLEARDDFKRQLEAIMDATKGKGRRRSRRHTSTSSSNNVSHNNSGTATSTETSLATRRTSSRLRSRMNTKAGEGTGNTSSSRVKSHGHSTEDSEHSQSDTITYDDPAGRMERERIMAQLKRGCSPCSEVDTEDQDDEETNCELDDQGKLTEFAVDCETSTNQIVPVEKMSMTIKSDPGSPQSSSTPAAPPLALQTKVAPIPEPVNLLEDSELNQSQTRAMTTPKFQLSVMTPQEKIDYSALIEQLGGKVFDTVYFNPECTHVVVGKPNRNEKYLAAVAAGKWVLHKSFLEASREAGHFVEEAPHEWGVVVPGEPSNKLASAAQRWRIKLLQERAAASTCNQGSQCCGAFSGWTVLLFVDKSRQPGFKRLLEAGGAKVSGSRPPFKNVHEFSHAFLDLAKTKVEPSDLQALHEANVWCLKPDYIAEYLMQEPPPPPQKYLLSEQAKPVEHDRQGLSLAKKRKGDELGSSDKRPRV